MGVVNLSNYKFKFERVLNYKKTVENHKKSLYTEIQQTLNKEEEILLQYQKLKDNLLLDKNNKASKISMGSLKMYNDSIKDINELIKKQEQIIFKLNEKVYEAKEELVEAVKEKKIFEKLKENNYEAYLYESKKAEENLLDSLVSFNIVTQ